MKVKPTTAPPGSMAKIEIMRQRIEDGLPVDAAGDEAEMRNGSPVARIEGLGGHGGGRRWRCPVCRFVVTEYPCIACTARGDMARIVPSNHRKENIPVELVLELRRQNRSTNWIATRLDASYGHIVAIFRRYNETEATNKASRNYGGD